MMEGVNKIRLGIVFLFFLILYGICLINLFMIQIKNNPFYENIGKNQYTTSVIRTPDRATIYDRRHNPLTLNKQGLTAFIVPNNLNNKPAVEKFLQGHFPQTYERLQKNSSKAFMYIKRHLTTEELELIHNAQLADIQLLQEPTRFYTVSSLGHTIGVTDSDNKGIMGIELILDKQLAGEPTTYVLEKDARSQLFYFTKECSSQGYEGMPAHVTLDADLQFLAYEELKKYCQELNALEGSVLIMDPATGDILVMACYPDFDSNAPLPENLWFTKNRIITEVFEPGSVMKIFPALAALEEKVITPTDIISCENKKETYINGMRVSTWKECGDLTFTDVIRYSNNIGTSKVSLKLGKKLYHYLKKSGFGNATGVNFLGEQSGVITPPNHWSKATPLSLSFGYEISASPLQLATSFCLLANDGMTIQPQLFSSPEHRVAHMPQRVYSSETINQMREIINLDHEGNTARIGRIGGYTVLGKTGTAYLITNGTYDTTRSIYTFAGIIEKNDYKRVVVTIIREPERRSNKPVYASTIAVPLFKNIAQSMLVQEKVV